MKKLSSVKKIIIILFLIILLLLLCFFILRKKQTIYSEKSQSTTTTNSPFGRYVEESPEEALNKQELKKDLSAPIITDYLKIMGMYTEEPEPGEGKVKENSQVENPVKAEELGYLKAWVKKWEYPDKIRLISQDPSDEIRGYFNVDCKDNTLYISKQDNSVVATGFNFISQLETDATVFIKCLDEGCNTLGGACILIK